MGMSIDLHVYDYFQLIGQIKKISETVDIPEGRSLYFFVEKILPKFGIRSADKYVTLWNEYYSDSGYNAGSELCRAVELYFGVDDVFLDEYDYFSGANAKEVLEEFAIEPIGEDEDYE